MDEVSERSDRPAGRRRNSQPPAIRRSDLIGYSLAGLLTISIVAVLYVARGFLLPLVAAFIVGTMLSPAAKALERWRIPRSVSAVGIVLTAFALAGLVVGMISQPIMEWIPRLPELGTQLRHKLQIIDRVTSIWHQVQYAIGAAPAVDGAGGMIAMPKLGEWVKPTIEFLSPTFTELLLFFVLLILFIASWPDLRKRLVLAFSDHHSRLRMLRILNEVEGSLGGYLLTVSLINLGVGIGTGVICFFTGMPNPAGIGALAAVLNFIPIIGPIVTFLTLVLIGVVTAATLGAGLMAAGCFTVLAFCEGHFITPAVIGRKLSLNALAVFISLAFWTWLWGPIGAFLSSPLLLIGLIVWAHFSPEDGPQLPDA
ncbi:MAG TPA: AI-2E family transporter [Xanthobacteraceae bacterium]|nr:AI-2E family transporter [Xanthobacteraceae bacterium]